MKRITKLVVLVLPLVLVASNSYAAVKPGSACKKAGQVTIASGKKFTCVKKGKALVWDKGVAVKSAPAPVRTPTPVASAPASTPIVPTGFGDLWEKRSGIAYAAWSSGSKAMAKGAATLPPVDIFRGPNTPVYLTDKNLITALENVAGLYAGAPMPVRIQVFVYSRADLQWGIDKAKAEMGVEYENAFQAHGGPMIKCNIPDDCGDGDAFVGGNKVAYLALGLSSKPDKNTLARYLAATGETCEFYHSLQDYFYQMNNSRQKNVGGLNPSNKPPHWLNIGGENMTSALVQFKDDYEGFRKQMSENPGWVNSLGINFTSAWIDEYLSINNLNNMWSNNRFGAPSNNAALMGQYLAQILVAAKDPSVLLEFHKLMSSGVLFEKAFLDTYGLTWASASPTISKVILDMYQNGY